MQIKVSPLPKILMHLKLRSIRSRRTSMLALAWFGVCLAASSCFAQETLGTVEAAMKPDGPWKAYPTRTLRDLPAAVTAGVDNGLDKFGGLSSRKVKATGFFYATKIGDRWWLVDPTGALFYNKGVASVSMSPTEGARAALKAKFGGESQWAAQTVALLRDNGFNGTGSWASDATLQTAPRRPVYTPIWNFAVSYGKARAASSKAGRFPPKTLFVFDPAFETFCDQHAKKLAATKNDPYLLGHFSDNELTWHRTQLKDHLTLPATEAGYRAAWQWMRARHGAKAALTDITEQDEKDFLEVVAQRYFRIVSKAIKKVDPNHLYLGSRFHGRVLNYPEVFRAAGPWVDVVSLNYYGYWTPVKDRMDMWERESKKPFLITEWYAKGMDSGMANISGAGWTVKTQADRGKFYQNFALGLLENPNCVGWHWFKYIDNDPTNTAADPSNTNSNKGIVTARYEPYPPLLDAMRELNQRAYHLIDFFDRQTP